MVQEALGDFHFAFGNPGLLVDGFKAQPDTFPPNLYLIISGFL